MPTFEDFLKEANLTSEQHAELTMHTDDIMPHYCNPGIQTIPSEYGMAASAKYSMSAGQEIGCYCDSQGKRTLELGRYCDHSENPNTVAKLDEYGNVILFSSRQIKGARLEVINEEITVENNDGTTTKIEVPKTIWVNGEHITVCYLSIYNLLKK